MNPVPISRNIERVRTNRDGSKVVRVYSGPKYWQDEAGNYSPITQERVAATSKLGAMELQRGVFFVGIRKDVLGKGRATKLVGLRPDNKQAGGKRQVEFSLDDFTIDGQTVELDLSKHEQVQAGVVDLGNVVIQTTSMRTRIITKIEGCSKDFNVPKGIHITGYRVEYRADLDEYWLFDEDTGEFGYRFVKPKLINLETYQPLGNAEGEEHLLGLELVKHTFDPATGIYTKTPGKDFDPSLLPKSYGIDVETAYSTSNDGYISKRGFTDGWDAVHDAVSGTAVNSTAAYYEYAIAANNPGGGDDRIIRGFISFNLAALSGTVTAADVGAYGYSLNGGDSSLQLGTQSDTLALADYDNFAGSIYGYISSWSLAGFNVWALPAQGISDVQDAIGVGLFKGCLRNYTYDVLDSQPPGTGNNCGMYFAETAGKEPYLELTLAAGGTPMLLMTNRGNSLGGNCNLMTG